MMYDYVWSYLFDLFDTFELDEKNNWIDLILMKSFNRTNMDIQNAMLSLKIYFRNKIIFGSERSLRSSNVVGHVGLSVLPHYALKLLRTPQASPRHPQAPQAKEN